MDGKSTDNPAVRARSKDGRSTPIALELEMAEGTAGTGQDQLRWIFRGVKLILDCSKLLFITLSRLLLILDPSWHRRVV